MFLLLFVGCRNHTEKTVLCKTPPMGFNSFDGYRGYLDQETAKRLIDVMAEKYLPYGYEYFVIDGGWYLEYTINPENKLPIQAIHTTKLISNIDEFGLPEPSKVYFPDGIKTLVDYVHKKGLKFGLHLMRGIMRQAIAEGCIVKGTGIPVKDIADTNSICAWSKMAYGVNMDKPGANEYYQSIIERMASWDIDFIKYDDITGFPREINAVVKAIKESGRQIVLSLSPGTDVKLEYLPSYENCNMLRITEDIWDNQLSLDRAFTAMKTFQGRGRAGFWPDLDMIPLGPLEVFDIEGKLGTTKKGKRISLLNKDQSYTFITQLAIFASPLIIGGDMLSMDKFTYKLLTNMDMLACNQNGVTGVLTYDKDSIEIYKAAARGDLIDGWIAIFNRKSSETSISLEKPDLGFYYSRPGLEKLMKWRDYKLRDIWQPKEFILKDSVDFTIPANGVVFIEYNEI